jgi:hypothetical protein
MEIEKETTARNITPQELDTYLSKVIKLVRKRTRTNNSEKLTLARFNIELRKETEKLLFLGQK